MRTLRARLLLSHTLPLLIIMLFIGLALDYLVETQILLPGFADELENEAQLLAELVSQKPELWDDATKARLYLDHLEPILEPNVSFITPQGEVLASSDPYILESEKIYHEQIEKVLRGDVWIQTMYSRQLDASVVEVFVPVQSNESKIVGVIQMTYHLENVYEQFLTLRRVIIGLLSIGILLGASIALILAINVSSALQNITLSIKQLVVGDDLALPLEQGPEEIRSIIRTVNSLVSQLHTMETNRQKLLANLIHELSRPLGALLPAIQAFQAGVVDNEKLQKELLSGMEDEINILRRLLDDLTGLYDQTMGTFDLTERPINMTEWLKRLLQTQREEVLAKGLSWRQEIPDDLPIITIDPGRIGQAIGNLINNAVKFTPTGGSVSVEAGVQSNWVWIQISDTGPGIPVEEQNKIFNAFYRGCAGNRFPEGMGLGLGVAQDLVLAHQGRLELESSPGEGSCFTILLPIPPLRE